MVPGLVKGGGGMEGEFGQTADVYSLIAGLAVPKVPHHIKLLFAPCLHPFLHLC